MDEPLSNLDAKLRVQMRTEISRIQSRLETATIYVTHNQTEALTLGDRIAVMRAGVLQQVGPPSELYGEPRNLFVAGFVGSPAMNFLPGAGIGVLRLLQRRIREGLLAGAGGASSRRRRRRSAHTGGEPDRRPSGGREHHSPGTGGRAVVQQRAPAFVRPRKRQKPARGKVGQQRSSTGRLGRGVATILRRRERREPARRLLLGRRLLSTGVSPPAPEHPTPAQSPAPV